MVKQVLQQEGSLPSSAVVSRGFPPIWACLDKPLFCRSSLPPHPHPHSTASVTTCSDTDGVFTGSFYCFCKLYSVMYECVTHRHERAIDLLFWWEEERQQLLSVQVRSSPLPVPTVPLPE